MSHACRYDTGTSQASDPGDTVVIRQPRGHLFTGGRQPPLRPSAAIFIIFIDLHLSTSTSCDILVKVPSIVVGRRRREHIRHRVADTATVFQWRASFKSNPRRPVGAVRVQIWSPVLHMNFNTTSLGIMMAKQLAHPSRATTRGRGKRTRGRRPGRQSHRIEGGSRGSVQPLPNPTSSPKTDPELLPAIREEIISMAADRKQTSRRHAQMPQFFTERNDIRGKYNYLRGEIKERRRILKLRASRESNPEPQPESEDEIILEKSSEVELENQDDQAQDALCPTTMPFTEEQLQDGAVTVYKRIENLQYQGTRNDERKSPSPISHPPEEVLCSDTSCPKSWYNSQYLEKYCGIELKNVQESIERLGEWFCPTCIYKAERIRESQRVDVPPVRHVRSKFGRIHLNHQEIRDHLGQLKVLLESYVLAASRKPLFVVPQPLLTLPLLQGELLDPEGCDPSPSTWITQLVRRILDVPPGILVKDKVKRMKLEDFSYLDLVRSVLVALLFEMAFESGSPFKDSAIWFAGLRYSFSEEVADMAIQDNHFRITETQEFKTQSRRRHEDRVAKLNQVMLPLVGADSEIHGLHQDMADIVEKLHIERWVYAGEFEGILPRTGALFDSQLHAFVLGEDMGSMAAPERILTTGMFGVRYRARRKEWRVLSPATVALFPPPRIDLT
ncbi:hypothetical protein B7494_g5805 [Chlorociboria aeruginascens]|nr:hypothetical protein B7494_g5805 [Chlorociboria aeruginascens]